MKLTREQREWLVVAVVGLAVFAVLGALNNGPRGPWNYLASLVIIVCVFTVFALGLSLQFGQGGLLNFGHVAFMGVGAYSVALVTLHWGDTLGPAMIGNTALGFGTALLGAALAAGVALVPGLLLAQRALRARPARTQLRVGLAAASLVGIVALLSMFPFTERTAANGVVLLGVVGGIILAALASLVLGLPAIRLREDYLAIVTLGAAEIFRAFVANEEQLTRGTLGIVALQRPIAMWALATPWWQDFAAAIRIRPIALAHAALGIVLVAVVMLMLQILARSPWGRVLKAIREDDAVAASLGKNVTLYKLQALMIGAGIAATAGILAAWNVNSVFPEHFLTITTFFAFIILVIGGIGNHKGALLGSIILWGIFSLSDSLTGFAFIRAGPIQNILIGSILILVMMLRPHGAIGRKEELILGK